MIGSDIKMAWQALRTNKARSLLTMFGIIVGVLAVVVTVSLGEGVRQQVVGETKQFGKDLIVIRPGKLVRRDQSGRIVSYNLLAGFGASTLTTHDSDLIRKTPNVSMSVPLSLVANGAQTADGATDDNVSVIATSDQLPQIINQKVQYGGFFESGDTNRDIAIIGQNVAHTLYQENVPIGKSLTARGHDFIVGGIFDTFPETPLSTTVDFNNSIFIPLGVGKTISGSNVNQVYEILAKAKDPGRVDETVTAIAATLRTAHGGQEDFTVLKQSETLNIAGSVLNVLTTFVAGIAAISLIVGGIGVMNIMLVSVTERTREIGIRKSVGATNRQIVGQFLTEAIVLSFTGGIIGLILSVFANFLIRIFTNLQPAITLPVMAIAAGVSIAVGIIFGITPAVKASRKDPIAALRYE